MPLITAVVVSGMSEKGKKTLRKYPKFNWGSNPS
jgi:hypothetical protein